MDIEKEERKTYEQAISLDNNCFRCNNIVTQSRPGENNQSDKDLLQHPEKIEGDDSTYQKNIKNMING